jgi:hypothetical protein
MIPDDKRVRDLMHWLEISQERYDSPAYVKGFVQAYNDDEPPKNLMDFYLDWAGDGQTRTFDAGWALQRLCRKLGYV